MPRAGSGTSVCFGGRVKEEAWMSLPELPSQNAADRVAINCGSLLSHSTGGWKSMTKVLAGLVSPPGLCP